MDLSKLKELKTENLILKKISKQDIQFINELFTDEDIKKYYIVPKEDQQDYRKLVSRWLSSISNGSGYAWIIYLQSNSFLSYDTPCGFIAFEFWDSFKNVRISYVLKSEFRKQGIMSRSIEIVINELKSLGVESVEADIYKDNTNSEKVIERLGFTTNKRAAMVDPEIKRIKDYRIRFLWRKELNDYSELSFYVIKKQDVDKLLNKRTVFRIFEEEIADGPDFDNTMSPPKQMEKTGRYHFVFQTDVTEKIVGISNDDETVYNIYWELLREEPYKDKIFLVFCGWGDLITGGGHVQFDYYEIGIEKIYFANLIGQLMSYRPDYFSISKLKNVIGLEGFKFENGKFSI